MRNVLMIVMAVSIFLGWSLVEANPFWALALVSFSVGSMTGAYVTDRDTDIRGLIFKTIFLIFGTNCIVIDSRNLSDIQVRAIVGICFVALILTLLLIWKLKPLKDRIINFLNSEMTIPHFPAG